MRKRWSNRSIVDVRSIRGPSVVRTQHKPMIMLRKAFTAADKSFPELFLRSTSVCQLWCLSAAWFKHHQLRRGDSLSDPGASASTGSDWGRHRCNGLSHAEIPRSRVELHPVDPPGVPIWPRTVHSLEVIQWTRGDVCGMLQPMGALDAHAARVVEGPVVEFRPAGSSLVPLIRGRQLVTVAPVDPTAVDVGDIVLVRVAGTTYLHLVSAVDNTPAVCRSATTGVVSTAGRTTPASMESAWPSTACRDHGQPTRCDEHERLQKPLSPRAADLTPTPGLLQARSVVEVVKLAGLQAGDVIGGECGGDQHGERGWRKSGMSAVRSRRGQVSFGRIASRTASSRSVGSRGTRSTRAEALCPRRADPTGAVGRPRSASRKVRQNREPRTGTDCRLVLTPEWLKFMFDVSEK